MTDSSDAGPVPLLDPGATPVAAMGEVGLYRALLDRLPDATVFVFDRQLRCVMVGGAAFTRLGWTRQEVLGRTPSEVLPSAEGRALEEHFQAALRGETRQHDHPGSRGSDVHWLSTIAPLRDAEGSIVGGTVISRDVAEVRRLEDAGRQLELSAAAAGERAQAERFLRERLQFLNEVNRVLAMTADRRDVMRAVTRAAVPRLGDWCSIHVFFEPQDRVPEFEVAHVDPAMVDYARQLEERFPYDPDAPTGVPRVVRTREPELVAEITEELLAEIELPDDALDVVRTLRLRSAITVPLVKWDRVVGAMQFVMSTSDRRYDPDDLTLAEAMAGRVASSLENHRLMEQQKEIAQTLQRSLLPSRLPDLPGVECGVAYRAAGEGTEVGGDFYDVFEIAEGRFGIVIGDVCGNGPHAAALTSLARHSVRANAWRGDRPSAVLAHVNDAVRRSEAATFCTLVFGQLSCRPDGVALTFANGGHPPPIVVPAGGAARVTGRLGRLVGVFEDARFGEETIDLAAGDTVVLYTDGVTDLPPPDAVDEDELLAMVEEAVRGGRDADEVAARLSAILDQRTPFGARHDDVALLVLRAAPTGRPPG